jgi:hypothetical protein
MDICRWCTKLDDEAHYFGLCPALESFWNSFTGWCQGFLNEDIKFTIEDILVGILINNTKYNTINACILLAKWHIYKSKLNETDAFFYKFLCELKYYLHIERIIAVKNNKLEEHNLKWHMVEDHLT